MVQREVCSIDTDRAAHLIFVYGTLKEGHGNYKHYLSQSLYHGPHKTSPNHTMLSLGGFPGVIYGDGTTAITGEVYEVDELTLRRIDRLEGYPDFYTKDQIITMYGMASIYVLSDQFLSNLKEDSRVEIESGEW